MFDEDSADVLRLRVREFEDVALSGCWELDVRADHAHYSPGLLRLLGVPALEQGPRYEPVLRHVAVEDRQLVRDTIEAALSAGGPYALEHRLLRPDGRLRWVQARGRVNVDERGDPVRMFTTCTDVTEARELLEWLARSTLEDPLTGLVNRFLVDDRLAQALRRGRRVHPTTTVLAVDIDGFTAINEQLGHRGGDDVLTAVAHRLRRQVRSGDTVGRYGADEFVVICEDLADPDGAVAVARRLAGALRMRPVGSARTDDVTASIGIAVAAVGETPHVVIGRASLAAAAAAREGPGRVMLSAGDGPP